MLCGHCYWNLPNKREEVQPSLEQGEVWYDAQSHAEQFLTHASWRAPAIRKRPGQLLEEAGYANGFDAGECGVDSVYAGVVEAATNDLGAVGIQVKVRPLERAAAFAAHKEKAFKHLAFQGSGAFGNASTRLYVFVYSKGAQSWVADPEIDAWYEQQAIERDRKKRETLLRQIQQKLYDEARHIPIWELASCVPQGRGRRCRAWD
jgi:peptide/nickel transport system substrate-binding protein